MDRIVALSRLFGVSADYLLTGEILTDSDRAVVGKLYMEILDQTQREIVVRRQDGSLTRLTPRELAMAFSAVLG